MAVNWARAKEQVASIESKLVKYTAEEREQGIYAARQQELDDLEKSETDIKLAISSMEGELSAVHRVRPPPAGATTLVFTLASDSWKRMIVEKFSVFGYVLVSYTGSVLLRR